MKLNLKNCIIIGLLVIFFYFVFGTIIGILTAHGSEISISYGIHTSKWTPNDIKHSSILVEVQTRDHGLIYESLVVEKVRSIVNSRSFDGTYYNGEYNSLMIGYQVGLHRRFNKLLVSGFGGFGTMPIDQPDIEHSCIVGRFGASIGFFIKDNLSLNYSIIHMSDPLHDTDSGQERQYFGIRISF